MAKKHLSVSEPATEVIHIIILVRGGWELVADTGTGDTRFPLVIGATGMWSAVLLAWIAVTFFGGGLVTVWMAFVVTAPFQAAFT